MQNSFIRSDGTTLMINQSQLVMYAAIAALVVVILAVVVVVAKRRKKDFIKTIPTNLKEDK